MSVTALSVFCVIAAVAWCITGLPLAWRLAKSQWVRRRTAGFQYTVGPGSSALTFALTTACIDVSIASLPSPGGWMWLLFLCWNVGALLSYAALLANTLIIVADEDAQEFVTYSRLWMPCALRRSRAALPDVGPDLVPAPLGGAGGIHGDDVTAPRYYGVRLQVTPTFSLTSTWRCPLWTCPCWSCFAFGCCRRCGECDRESDLFAFSDAWNAWRSGPHVSPAGGDAPSTPLVTRGTFPPHDDL
jgi:hypothetical protein